MQQVKRRYSVLVEKDGMWTDPIGEAMPPAAAYTSLAVWLLLERMAVVTSCLTRRETILNGSTEERMVAMASAAGETMALLEKFEKPTRHVM